MAGGYAFSEAVMQGQLLNTFETCVPWQAFEPFHHEVTAAVNAAIARVCSPESAASAVVTCRFTHVYPDGPAPYYSVFVDTSAEVTAGKDACTPHLRYSFTPVLSDPVRCDALHARILKVRVAPTTGWLNGWPSSRQPRR